MRRIKRSSTLTFEDWKKRALRKPAFRKALEEPDDDPFLEVAYQILQYRKRAGLTQAQLAERMGTTQQQIARLECLDYRGFTLTTLEKAAKALHRRLKVSFVPA